MTGHTDSFNDTLARAKTTAVRILTELLARLADPAYEATPRDREARMVASTILRTRPLAEDAAPAAPHAAEPVASPPTPGTAPHAPSRPARSRLAHAAALLLAAGAPAAAQPFFLPLGDLPTGDVHSSANAISADGSTVVGSSSVLLEGNTEPTMQAFRWTRDAGMVSLGTLAGFAGDSEATGVSADGSVIVGVIWAGASENPRRPFIWSAEAGMRELPLLPGHLYGEAVGVSADGRTIAGWSGGGPRAVRWTPEGIESIGGLDGGTTAQPYAISADGSTIVGAVSGGIPFRWRADTGMIFLGHLPDGYSFTRATAVNADGSIVVGNSFSDLPHDFQIAEIFTWSEAAGMTGLGFIGRPLAVSANGDFIGGWRYTVSPQGGAFIYQRGEFALPFHRLLMQFRLADEIEGWSFASVAGMTPDGRTYAGTARDAKNQYTAFIAGIGPHCLVDWDRSGTIDSQDLFDFLTSFFSGAADYTGDGVTDSRDWMSFLNDWRFQDC